MAARYARLQPTLFARPESCPIEFSTIEHALREFKRENDLKCGVALRGEMCGPNVLENRLQLDRLMFFSHGMFDTGPGNYMSETTLSEFCSRYDIQRVPQLGIFTMPTRASRSQVVHELIDMSIGESKINRAVMREGVVFRLDHGDFYAPEVDDPDLGRRASFKVISPKYLIRHGD